jgi:hypothetical protein
VRETSVVESSGFWSLLYFKRKVIIAPSTPETLFNFQRNVSGVRVRCLDSHGRFTERVGKGNLIYTSKKDSASSVLASACVVLTLSEVLGPFYSLKKEVK